ncbi:MAG: hypothetical protein M8357_03175, partial [Desulfobulbaceae bacterium]|nr:hypothetical protein [Desulfobulbaceae bacterium]
MKSRVEASERVDIDTHRRLPGMGRMILAVFILAVLLVAESGFAASPAWIIRAGRGVYYDTIQLAVDAAVAGETIHLTGMVISGTGNKNITISKDISIVAANEETVIDLEGDGTAFIITSSGVILDGITIRNGSGYRTWNDEGIGDYGGAIYVHNSSPLIQNCTLFNNHAYGGGGALYVNNGSPTIQNTRFINNYSRGSGGAAKFWSGGASTVTGSTFTGNRAGTDGGAIHAETGMAELVVTSSSFVDNTAYSYGGAIYIESGYTVINSVFVRNKATVQKTGSGGAIRVENTSAGGTITFSSFHRNSAPAYGGALSFAGPAILINSIVWGNSATYGQQVAVTEFPVDPDFWLYNSSLDVERSDLEGGLTAIYGTATSSKGANIALDPLFAFDDDLHLLPDSPCIDAGSNAGGVPAADIAGNARPQDGDGDTQAIPDMGAYEFVPGVAAAAVSPRSLRFKGMEGEGLPGEQPVSLRNNGSGVLDYTIAVWPSTQPLLRAEPVTGSASDEVVTVKIYLDETQWNALPPGVYYMRVDILDGADNTTVLASVPVV